MQNSAAAHAWRSESRPATDVQIVRIDRKCREKARKIAQPVAAAAHEKTVFAARGYSERARCVVARPGTVPAVMFKSPPDAVGNSFFYLLLFHLPRQPVQRALPHGGAAHMITRDAPLYAPPINRTTRVLLPSQRHCCCRRRQDYRLQIKKFDTFATLQLFFFERMNSGKIELDAFSAVVLVVAIVLVILLISLGKTGIFTVVMDGQSVIVRRDHSSIAHMCDIINRNQTNIDIIFKILEVVSVCAMLLIMLGSLAFLLNPDAWMLRVVGFFVLVMGRSSVESGIRNVWNSAKFCVWCVWCFLTADKKEEFQDLPLERAVFPRDESNDKDDVPGRRWTRAVPNAASVDNVVGVVRRSSRSRPSVGNDGQSPSRSSSSGRAGSRAASRRRSLSAK
jgi:hypothetical protein